MKHRHDSQESFRAACTTVVWCASRAVYLRHLAIELSRLFRSDHRKESPKHPRLSLERRAPPHPCHSPDIQFALRQTGMEPVSCSRKRKSFPPASVLTARGCCWELASRLPQPVWL